MRILAAVLVGGPLSGLGWAAVAGGGARPLTVMAVCSGVSGVVAAALLAAPPRVITVPVLQAVLFGYVVLLCVVAEAIGDVFRRAPFLSHLAWALPIAFLVLPLGRALATSVWALGCVVALSLKEGRADSWDDLAPTGLPVSTLVVMTAVTMVLVLRMRHDAERQWLLAEFGRRALSHPDTRSLVADVEATGALLVGRPVVVDVHCESSDESAPGAYGAVPSASGGYLVLQADSTTSWWADDTQDGLALTGLAAIAGPALDRIDSLAAASHAALHDALTGLPNRVLARDRLQHALTRRDAAVAVFLLDLDAFKSVNDGYGHLAGDELLRDLGVALRGTVRPADTVARLGGDEFLVIAEDVHSPVAAAILAERLATAWEKPLSVAGVEHFVSASVGVALSHPESTVTDLLREADVAMYRAKRAGRGRVELFDDGMRAQMHHELTLESDLHRAVRDRGFDLVFQPILDLRTGEPVCFETLARWTHPERGVIGPAEFIPAAERLGLIRDLGAWTLRESVQVLETLHDASADVRRRGGLGITVNVSPLQIEDPAFVSLVTDIVSSTSLPPSCLGLEVTEGVLMADLDAALRVLDAVRETGVRVLLDDFGTGFSSLSYLHRFRLDAIKIDRSFVARLGGDPAARAIVGAVVSIGEDLGVDVIAEGVETEQQFDQLRQLHVGHAQGFGLGRPMPAAMTGAWLKRDRREACTWQGRIAVQGEEIGV